METTQSNEKPMTTWQIYRTRAVLALGAAGLTLTPLASAGALNDSVSPIIGDMVELFTPMLSLVVSAVPLIIAVSMISFILGILSAILGRLRMG